MPHQKHERFMHVALAEARKGVGRVSPNPAVGAALVQDGQIISTGYHRATGLPHAEIECLAASANRSLRSATLYVTLEPCSTTGRTPPCTDAIARAGLKRVVIGAMDLNPAHSGRAVRQLRAAGIEVLTGILAPECSALNEAFNKWIVTRRPFVIAKCGMSLDGRLTRRPNEDRWLTSAASRRDAHRLRAEVDAILIGAETVRHDNPRLTIRGALGARQPWRVVLSDSRKLPRKAHLFTDRFATHTLIFSGKDLAEVLRELGEKEVTSVLIEGGGKVLGAAFAEGLVDKVEFYLAPFFTGGPVAAVGGKGADSTAAGVRLTNMRYKKIGSDLCITGHTYSGANG
jgi:diaminohydroxyphosphoribosylaminopyrimidine deaminase/5-amino-6-(5-phosphoribosylamino)uracil reductase